MLIKGFVKGFHTNKGGFLSIIVGGGKKDVFMGSGKKMEVPESGAIKLNGISIKKGNNISCEVDEDDYNKMDLDTLKVTEAPKASGKAAGGSSGGGNYSQVGQAIGAGGNVAMQLYAAGKITEGQVPLVVMNHYKLMEYAKKLAEAGRIEELADLEGRFSYTKAVVTKPAKVEKEEEEEAPKSKAKKPAGRPKKAPEPEPEEEEEEDTHPLDEQHDSGVDEEEDVPF